jgi:hypothetical protein
MGWCSLTHALVQPDQQLKQVRGVREMTCGQQSERVTSGKFSKRSELISTFLHRCASRIHVGLSVLGSGPGAGTDGTHQKSPRLL